MTPTDILGFWPPVVLGVLGLMTGSFLNVCIYRLPRNCMSLVSPGSRCPECLEPIAWYDNIPVISYLFLRGRCRHCDTSISIKYPLVELMTAILFLFLYFSWEKELGSKMADLLHPGISPVSVFSGGMAYLWGELLIRVVLLSSLIVISFIDLRFRIIPNEITVSGIVLGPLVATLYPEHLQHFLALPSEEVLQSAPLRGFLSSLLGILVGGGIIYLLKVFGEVVFQKPSMGWGDIKMMAAIGGLLGWSSVILVLFIGSIAGTVIGLINLWITRDHYIPFGPFLSIGAGVMLFKGRAILIFLRETYQVAFPL